LRLHLLPHLILSLNSLSSSLFLGFEVYLKSKIEKLSKIETQNLDCKSPDYHEHFSAKSIDESKASVYFTPNDDGHLSPQPPQLSPIHVNYINENMIGCEMSAAADGSSEDEARCAPAWRAVSMRNNARSHHFAPTNRNSFRLPGDYLDEEDELMGNFIIPDPVYADPPCTLASCERFEDVIEAPVDSESISSLASASNSRNARRRKKKYRDKEKRLSTLSIENEAFLMQEMQQNINSADVSKGARPKVYDFQNYNKSSRRKESRGEWRRRASSFW
jgi:hypothetical protein